MGDPTTDWRERSRRLRELTTRSSLETYGDQIDSVREALEAGDAELLKAGALLERGDFRPIVSLLDRCFFRQDDAEGSRNRVAAYLAGEVRLIEKSLDPLGAELLRDAHALQAETESLTAPLASLRARIEAIAGEGRSRGFGEQIDEVEARGARYRAKLRRAEERLSRRARALEDIDRACELPPRS